MSNRQSFPRYLPLNGPVYYDPVDQCYRYLYDNGNMAVVGNDKSLSSGIELDGIVLALVQDIVSLRKELNELKTLCAQTKPESTEKTGE